MLKALYYFLPDMQIPQILSIAATAQSKTELPCVPNPALLCISRAHSLSVATN